MITHFPCQKRPLVVAEHHLQVGVEGSAIILKVDVETYLDLGPKLLRGELTLIIRQRRDDRITRAIQVFRTPSVFQIDAPRPVIVTSRVGNNQSPWSGGSETPLKDRLSKEQPAIRDAVAFEWTLVA
jgi:hypothetical protein